MGAVLRNVMNFIGGKQNFSSCYQCLTKLFITEIQLFITEMHSFTQKNMKLWQLSNIEESYMAADRSNSVYLGPKYKFKGIITD